MKKTIKRLSALTLSSMLLFSVAQAETFKLPIEGTFQNQPQGNVARDKTKTVNGSHFTLNDDENSVIVRFQPEDGGKMEYYISLYDNTEQRYITAGDMPGLPENMVGPISSGEFKFTGLTGGNSYSVRIATAINYASLKGEVCGDRLEAAADSVFPSSITGAVSAAARTPNLIKAPGDTVSRADMCVLIRGLLPPKKQSVQILSFEEYPFTDIPEDASFKDAVDELIGLKVINGVGDGKFMPEEAVTNVQAVKMLVCSLGYGGYAENLGGWPRGYLACGRELGLYGGDAPDSPALWQDVQKMLDTAYNLPHMCMSEYSAAGKAVFYQAPDITYAAFN